MYYERLEAARARRSELIAQEFMGEQPEIFEPLLLPKESWCKRLWDKVDQALTKSAPAILGGLIGFCLGFTGVLGLGIRGGSMEAFITMTASTIGVALLCNYIASHNSSTATNQYESR